MNAERGWGLFLRIWTRKLHYYVGLYFLLFLWLFSLSGLSLNHPKWEWMNPRFERESVPRQMPLPLPPSDGAAAAAVMKALDLRGELHRIERLPNEGVFRVWVLRPNKLYVASVRLDSGRVQLEERDTNLWGVLRGLHTFNGVSVGNRSERREWVLTTIWTYSMDLLALGLVFTVVSGVYMWLVRKRPRWWEWTLLVVGTALCLFFWLGLSWIY